MKLWLNSSRVNFSLAVVYYFLYFLNIRILYTWYWLVTSKWISLNFLIGLVEILYTKSRMVLYWLTESLDGKVLWPILSKYKQMNFYVPPPKSSENEAWGIRVNFNFLAPLRANPRKWSNTHKQFVWAWLTILWGWRLKGWIRLILDAKLSNDPYW